MKISCVIPTRNRDKVIGEAIKSIIKQTESSWELVIVDDHSGAGDATEEVVNSFADKRIRYFKLSDDHGQNIPCARNFGNVMARGEIIVVMDSDDISYHFRFKETLDAFTKTGADLVYGEIDYWWPETGEIKQRDDANKSRQFSLEELKKINFIPHVTVAYRRQLILDFPYNSFFTKGEDYELYGRLAEYGKKFYFIDKSLVKCRLHDQSIMAQPSKTISYTKTLRQVRGWNE